ncbi:hypothetical protein [Halosimplex pelagicum]|uniref:Uncharacterized protein n=1 Tax=Halosimplex pelagicum TaxID=869886 RepID=A0A7D5P4F3_9EURY|nr:hypothetical protein [Halosimplex pelagicum]QLH80643.1 hypothetical protein HZS54_02900 [Halosimplex pelagicum]
MSLGDRERVEGFHRVPSSTVETPASERVEGFHRVPSSTVETPASERIPDARYPKPPTRFDRDHCRS